MQINVEISKHYWIQKSISNKKFYVFFQDYVLDLTKFIQIHPGGDKAIENYKNKDITSYLFKIYPHSPNILKTLMKYQVGVIRLQCQRQQQNNNKASKPSLITLNKLGSKPIQSQNSCFSTSQNSSKKTVTYKKVQFKQRRIEIPKKVKVEQNRLQNKQNIGSIKVDGDLNQFEQGTSGESSRQSRFLEVKLLKSIEKWNNY